MAQYFSRKTNEYNNCKPHDYLHFKVYGAKIKEGCAKL